MLPKIGAKSVGQKQRTPGSSAHGRATGKPHATRHEAVRSAPSPRPLSQPRGFERVERPRVDLQGFSRPASQPGTASLPTFRVNPMLLGPLAAAHGASGAVQGPGAFELDSARRRLEAAVGQGPEAFASEFQAIAQQHHRALPNDTAFFQELTRSVAPLLQGFGEELAGEFNPGSDEQVATALTSLIHTANQYGGPQAGQAVADTLVQGFQEAGGSELSSGWTEALLAGAAASTQSPQELVRPSSFGSGALETLAGALERAGATRSSSILLQPEAASGFVAQDLQAAQAQLTQALGGVAELEDMLGQQLALVGAGLTEVQRQEYIETFRAEHQQEYAAVRQAEQQLLELLQAPETQAAVVDNPQVARSVLDGYQSLAGGSAAPEVLEWAGELFSEPNSELYRAFQAARPGFAETFGDEVLPRAIEAASGELLVREGLQGGDVLDRFDELLGPLRNARTLASTELGLLTADWEQLSIALRTPGGPSALTRLLDSWGDASGLGPLRQSLATAGLVFSIGGAADAIADGDLYSLTTDLLSAGSGGAQLVANALGRLGQTGQAAAAVGGTAASTAATFLARGAPVLSALSSALSGGRSAAEFFDERTASSALSALGSFTSAAGALLPLFTTGPVGGILAAVGGAISLSAQLVESIERRDQALEDAAALLAELDSVPRELVERLVLSDALGQLPQLGFSAESIQHLLQENPRLYATDRSDDAERGLFTAFQALGLTTPGQYQHLLDHGGLELGEEILRQYQIAIQNTPLTSEQQQSAWAQVRGWLQQSHPELIPPLPGLPQ